MNDSCMDLDGALKRAGLTMVCFMLAASGDYLGLCV